MNITIYLEGQPFNVSITDESYNSYTTKDLDLVKKYNIIEIVVYGCDIVGVKKADNSILLADGYEGCKTESHLFFWRDLQVIDDNGIQKKAVDYLQEVANDTGDEKVATPKTDTEADTEAVDVEFDEDDDVDLDVLMYGEITDTDTENDNTESEEIDKAITGYTEEIRKLKNEIEDSKSSKEKEKEKEKIRHRKEKLRIAKEYDKMIKDKEAECEKYERLLALAVLKKHDIEVSELPI